MEGRSLSTGSGPGASAITIPEAGTSEVGSPEPSADGVFASEPESGVVGPVKHRRKPIPRKGHTKSRRGCVNCKRRKVKCPENIPECDHCRRLGLVCEFPLQLINGRDGRGGSSGSSATPNDLGGADEVALVLAAAASPSRTLQTTPATFSMDDMRFFQHFLLHAYPPLPLHGDAIWREVAAISHEYDFLIHAMLGLAASHLSLHVNSSYGAQALSHRVSSIKSLNEALDRPCASKGEGDARFATMMALTFQTSCIADGGMIEFVQLVRGCDVVAQTAMNFSESIFAVFTEEGHIGSLRTMNSVEEGQYSGPQDEELLVAFLASLRSLAPLLRSTVEVQWLASIERASRIAMESSVEVDPIAFIEISHTYKLIGAVSNDEFQQFVDRDNWGAQLLLIHFFLIEYVLGHAALGPVASAFSMRRKIGASWVSGLANGLPPAYRKYMVWPVKCYKAIVENEAERDSLVGGTWPPFTPAVSS